MKTIGIILKEARAKKHMSRAKLEKETKIKAIFVTAIEEEHWSSLPEYPVVVGFVKRIAKATGVDEAQAVATLRRDYPPTTLNPNPKPELFAKFSWNPRLTFVLGVVVVTLTLVAYLVVQYIKFVSPPRLEVDAPVDSEVVAVRILRVYGTTDPNVVVRVNNQPTLIDELGNFTTEVEIYEGTTEIEVKAISRSGKETVIKRKIKPELFK